MQLRYLPILAGAALLASGCGGDGHKVARVSGRVTLNGKPVEKVSVTFNPVAEGTANSGPSSVGITDAEGRYTLKLVSTTDAEGAVVGKHKVRFANSVGPWDPDLGPRPPKPTNPIPTKYNRADMDYEVSSGGTKAADFDLTSP